MVQETVNTRLSEAGQFLAVVDKLADSVDRVVVLDTLHGRCSAKNVREQRGMSNLLVGHELDEEPIIGSETSILEVLDREFCKTEVEEVKLNPFLIQCEGLWLG